MMTAAENIPPFLLPIKNKKCANFFILATLDFYLIYYCVHVFCQLPPRTAAALSMEKNKTFYDRTRGQKQNKPRSPCVSLIIAVIS